MRKIVLKPYHGVIAFIVFMIVFLFVAPPLQMNLGMIGLALTQLLILAFAVIPVLLTGNSIKEVFPIKKVPVRQIFAVLLYWGGAFLMVLSVNMLIQLLFPQQMIATSESLTDFFHSVPFIFSFMIVAIMPAICEEALHRGLIQHSMAVIKRKWVLVLIMGIIFGVFHLDPVRILGTAILGATLSYIMMETGNIILPCIFHFVNNAISVSVSALTSNIDVPHEAAELTFGTAEILSSMGIFIALCTFVPFLLYFGGRLLHSKEYHIEHKEQRRKSLIAAGIISPFLLITGIALVMAGSITLLTREPIISASWENNIAERDEFSIELDVVESRNYLMDLSLEADGFITDIRLLDDNGNQFYQNILENNKITGYLLNLSEGKYHFTLTFIKEKEALLPYMDEMGYTAFSEDTINKMLDVYTDVPNEYMYSFSLQIY